MSNKLTGYVYVKSLEQRIKEAEALDKAAERAKERKKETK